MTGYRYCSAPSFTDEERDIVSKILSYDSSEYYDILEVDKNSSESEISNSYRRLAAKLHPDNNSHPMATDAFKQLNEAWSTLGDPVKRREYDIDQDMSFSVSSSDSYFNNSFDEKHRIKTPIEEDQSYGFGTLVYNMFFSGGGFSGSYTKN
ncbi:DnaJ domain-containing protein [Scheffersomyces xylosifermentans]|uniref:DnaJ domain-containing protein n=1 Tax=Scheffersomyces xylosifermentans TaxID=1304137 RepID=UPI00315D1840